MKAKNHLIILLLIFSSQLWAGSISGVISYSGTANYEIAVAVFTDSTLDSYPTQIANLTEPGNFSLNDLKDTTYYLVAIMSQNFDNILPTDPFAFYGTLEFGLTPIVISGNNDITGIELVLVDGTVEYPNPFAQYYVTPDKIIQLPETTMPGTNPSMVYDGTSIYLYKHDYDSAASAKIYKLNPEMNAVLSTYNLALESSPNRISWIDKMAFRNEVLWAFGGFGDPSGMGYIDGVFKIDISTSNSSSQLKFNSLIYPTNGFACDGVNFYVGVVDTFGVNGIVKFNPDEVSEVPADIFIDLGEQNSRRIIFDSGFLWVGTERIKKFNAESGEYIESIELPGSVAELFIDETFYRYNESENALELFYLSSVGIDFTKENTIVSEFSLSQNYPNPFNPSTTIKFGLPNDSHVKLELFNILGEKIATLIDEEMGAGFHNYQLSTVNYQLPSGIYLYKFQSGGFVQTKKLILLK